MGGPTRIKGDALKLTIDGVDRWTECTAVTIDQSDDGIEDDVFCFELPIHDLYRGWHMDVTAVQSTAEGSLWRLLFEHDVPDIRDPWVPYVYAPHGNETPTGDKPHFTGQLILPQVTLLGGQAGRDTEYVFSVTLPLDRKPRMLTEPN